METLDYRNIIKKNTPSFFKFIPHNEPNWDKVNKAFEERTKDLELEITQQSRVLMNFHNLLFGAEVKKDEDKKGFLDLIEYCIEFLNRQIQSDDIRKQVIKQILMKILIIKDDKFFNHCGELFALTKILKLEQYELITIEPKLPNGKHADFALINKNINREKERGVFVEIVNLHHENDKSDEYLKRWIEEHKINQKLDSELKDLNIKEWNYLLQPIIWCWGHNNLEQLKRIEKTLYFPNNVLGFCTVVKQTKGTNKKYVFGSLKLIELD